MAVDLAALRAGLEPLHDVVRRVCGGVDDDDHGPGAILVERSAHRVSVRLAELGGDDLSEEHVVRVTPAPVGAPPLEPRPVPAFDLLNDYLLAVNACHGRPWEYSNFMASDTYTPPGKSAPTIFSEEWLCTADVPPDRRAD